MDGRLEVDQPVDRHVDRLRQVIRQRLDLDALEDVEERPAELLDGVRLADHHERARRPSAPRSSGPRTGRRGASDGRPGRAGRPGRGPGSASCRRPTGRRATFWPIRRWSSSKSWPSRLSDWDGTPWPKTTAGSWPARRRRATCLPVISRWVAARVGRSVLMVSGILRRCASRTVAQAGAPDPVSVMARRSG